MTLVCRLLAEKMNKNERKNMSEIVTIRQGDESSDFLKLLGVDDITTVSPPTENSDDTFVQIHPTLYQVGLGMGYLELPQGIAIFVCTFFIF